MEVFWLDIARYQPLRGGSYIPLPAVVRLKKAVVNVKNKDDHFLRWALRSALFPAWDHVDRPSKYPTDDGLDFEGIDVPTPISQVPKVELKNDLAIKVFGWNKVVIIYHLSKQPQEIPRINLLLIEKAGKFHRREAHLLSILVSKEPLSQGPVPALHDALVPVDVNTSTSDLDPVFGEQLAHRTHELAPRVNLKEVRPPQGALLVNPSQAIGNLCRGLASQRLNLFVVRGHINDPTRSCGRKSRSAWWTRWALPRQTGSGMRRGQADSSARWPAF